MAWIAIGLALALLGCSKSANEGNTSASAATADVQLRPGEWEVVRETTSVSAADSFFGSADKKGEKTTKRECITPEQAAQPVKTMQGQDQAQCDYNDFTFATGRIAGTISCGSAGPGKITISVNGQYDEQSYAHTDTLTNKHESGDTVVEYHVTGRRLGECTGP
jgi:hypothetical protein